MSRTFKILVFIPIVVLLLYIFIFDFGLNFRAHADQEGNISTIGGIEVGDKKEDEIKKILTDAIDSWRENPLVIEGGGYQLQIDASQIEFQVDATIDTYRNLVERPWYMFWKDEKVVHIPLDVVVENTIKEDIKNVSYWDGEETISNILSVAAYLKNGPVKAEFSDYSILETERLAFEIQTIPQFSKGVYELANDLNETIVASQEVFSFIHSLENSINQSNTEGASFVASLLYSVVLNTNTEIFERHSQNVIPKYLEAGVEAAVNVTGTKDFKLSNLSERPFLIKASVEGNNLKIEIYSSAKEDNVSVRVVQNEEINPKTITRYSKDLAMGSKRVLVNGEKGLRVYIYRTINGEEQQPIRDYYPPINNIVLKSSRVPVVQRETDMSIQSGNTDLTSPIEDPSNEENQDANNGDENISSEDPVYDKGGNLISK